MSETTKNRQKKRIAMVALLVLFSLALLMSLEFVVMTGNSREQAYRTATVVSDQVASVLESNQRKESALIESLKENYIAKAKAVAYIIDTIPELEYNTAELFHIAKLLSIDEIHIFDESGTIYTGTVPIYYGYSFDSGEQMGYFKPMLENKALSMCQDVTPNTAEGKSMMYAICWDDAGERMVQVGIEPVRLLDELRTNEVSEVIASLPAYQGIGIIVADSATGEVIGSTAPRQVGRSLHELGLETEDPVRDLTAGFSAVVDHEPSYCVLGQADDYTIVVTQNKADVNQNIPTIMLTTLLYLLLAVAVICFLAWRMTRHIIDEQKNANTDMLTGLANRRAYENDIAALAGDPRREDLTYIVLDLNGLKTANDTWGHEAGDELLTNVSRYMVDCFGDYGTVYRTGGDEFVALLFVEDAQLTIAEEEFSSLLDAWSRRRGRELSVSWGTAKAREEPELSIPELAKKADDRMYAAKAAYYKAKGRDRRR